MTTAFPPENPDTSPTLNLTTAAWLIGNIFDRVDVQIWSARLDIDEVLQHAATDLPTDLRAALVSTIDQLVKKLSELDGLFVEVPLSAKSAIEIDEHDETEAGALRHCIAQSPEELTAIDARSYAMIARASIANAVRYHEPVAPACVHRVQEAIEQLEQALRIVEYGDPEAS